MSHGFQCQNAASETPRIVSTRSIEMLSAVNSPVSRNVWLRPSLRITATRMWFIATKETHAASPAIAKRRCAFAIRPVP
jgi:hypothetical protein